MDANIVTALAVISFFPIWLLVVRFPMIGEMVAIAQTDNDIGLSANDIAALPQRYFARCAKRYSPSATANGMAGDAPLARAELI